MKKAITQLLNSEEATLHVNQFVQLHRYTRTPYDVDTATDTVAVYVNIGQTHVKLISDASTLGAQAVIDRVLDIQREAFESCLGKLEKQIKNGFCQGRIEEGIE